MDIAYLVFLQNIREAIGGCLNSFFAFITTIAVDYYVVVPAMIIFWTINKKKGARVLLTFGTSISFNAFLKATFCVYRPWIRSDAVKPLQEVIGGATGYSFPSGHSASASGFYCGLISVYRKHKALCVLFGMMIALTMFSRNFVGVHTPQDVLVGCTVGILAAVLITKIAAGLEAHPERDWIILLVAGAACAALLAYTYYKPYPMDYVDGQLLVDPKKMTVDGFKDPGVFFGIVLGWFVERRFVKFEISGTTAQKVTRAMAGGILYVLYYTLVPGWLGKRIGIGMVHFVLSASAPLLFMTVYPIVFSKLQKRTVEA